MADHGQDQWLLPTCRLKSKMQSLTDSVDFQHRAAELHCSLEGLVALMRHLGDQQPNMASCQILCSHDLVGGSSSEGRPCDAVPAALTSIAPMLALLCKGPTDPLSGTKLLFA